MTDGLEDEVGHGTERSSRTQSPSDDSPIGATDMLTARNPVTGEVLGTVPLMDAAEVRQQVQFARRAQHHWGALDVRERCDRLGALQDVIAGRARDVTNRIAAMTAKPHVEAAMMEVHATCLLIHSIRKMAPRVLAPQRVSPGIVMNKKAWKSYEPLGVVAAISPWNVPFTLSMAPIVSALAAGNAVVLKPSELTPLIGELIVELADEAGLPERLVCVATGDGSTGAALVRSGVDKIHFTGSTETGRKIMAGAAENLTPVVMELGGKDPMLVCSDADMERAAAGAVWGAFANLGQACLSIERAYVHTDIHDDFVGRVTEQAGALRQGYEPAYTDTTGNVDVTALIRHEQLDVIESQIRDAVDRGATVACGGRLRPDLEGDYYEPTVLTDVDHTMLVMRDETFGPVLAIQRVANMDEAVELANDSEYGLTASIWSRSESRAIEIGERLATGSVTINDHTVSYGIIGLPFGGVKSSGFGRVHGDEGLLEFVRSKAWTSHRFGPKEIYWFPIGRRDFDSAVRLTGTLYRRGLGKLQALIGR